jgi:hypothetical protein
MLFSDNYGRSGVGLVGDFDKDGDVDDEDQSLFAAQFGQIGWSEDPYTITAAAVDEDGTHIADAQAVMVSEPAQGQMTSMGTQGDVTKTATTDATNISATESGTEGSMTTAAPVQPVESPDDALPVPVIRSAPCEPAGLSATGEGPPAPANSVMSPAGIIADSGAQLSARKAIRLAAWHMRDDLTSEFLQRRSLHASPWGLGNTALSAFAFDSWHDSWLDPWHRDGSRESSRWADQVDWVSDNPAGEEASHFRLLGQAVY